MKGLDWNDPLTRELASIAYGLRKKFKKKKHVDSKKAYCTKKERQVSCFKDWCPFFYKEDYSFPFTPSRVDISELGAEIDFSNCVEDDDDIQVLLTEGAEIVANVPEVSGMDMSMTKDEPSNAQNDLKNERFPNDDPRLTKAGFEKYLF